MVNSIKKGHLFELQVAKWLTTITGKKFHRVPMSGATATNFKLDGLRGDLMTESEYRDLVIECKSYKGPVTLADINNAGSLFNSWIAQTKKEAGNRTWMLFFKSNRGPVFLLIPTTDGLAYATDNTLKPIFIACRGVCQTKEWMLFEIIDWDRSQTRPPG